MTTKYYDWQKTEPAHWKAPHIRNYIYAQTVDYWTTEEVLLANVGPMNDKWKARFEAIYKELNEDHWLRVKHGMVVR